MMTIAQRIFWICAIAVASFIAVVVYLAGLESLARLMRQ
jgi:hypothetical protein